MYPIPSSKFSFFSKNELLYKDVKFKLSRLVNKIDLAIANEFERGVKYKIEIKTVNVKNENIK